MSQNTAPIPVIIDTDPGIDDAMAIHYASAHPDIELVGLTTVFGNVFVEQATRNALFLKEQTCDSFDVVHGADAPLEMPLNPPSHYVHGDEGLGDMPAPKVSLPTDSRDTSQYIYDICSARPGEVVLCPVGPLTNIARLVREKPDIVSLVKRVVIMGGAVWADGNFTPHAEANIWNDPHAADIVFSADWEIDLIGLDVTQKITCTQADFDMLASHAPEIGGFLAQISEFYIKFYHSVQNRYVCVMHDPTALVAITNRTLFTFKKAPLSVTLSGEKIGNSHAASDSGRRAVNVCIDADVDAVRKRFLDICALADKIRAERRA